jgi:hypothetical protein
MLGYKVAKTEEDVRCIITLLIPSDAMTNLNRTSVKNKQYAKYRTNKAYVVEIADIDGSLHKFAWSAFSTKQMLYAVGGLLEDEDYDADSENVCSGGIHFFLERGVAELYRLTRTSDGLLQKWYDNGNLREQLSFTNGCADGLCREWYYNGQLRYEGTYICGKQHGVVKKWHPNGVLCCEWMFDNGIENGLFRRWSDTGHLEGETYYKNGVII